MLKKAASIILVSLRSSTYRSVRLASSLAAATLDGLFEHPARGTSVVPSVPIREALEHTGFFCSQLTGTG